MISIPSLRLASPKRQLSKTLVAYCSMESSPVDGTTNTATCARVLCVISCSCCVSDCCSEVLNVPVISVTCWRSSGTAICWASPGRHHKVNRIKIKRITITNGRMSRRLLKNRHHRGKNFSTKSENEHEHYDSPFSCCFFLLTPA